MGASSLKDKHLKIDQKKIDKAKEVLGVRTETEAIDRALDNVIQKTGPETPGFKWAGALKKMRNRYTSVELQHKLGELRSGK